MAAPDDRKMTGMVFNIQKYSVHDGPGIRTVVFLKGCPLACRWCSNPESQQIQPQVACNTGRCLTLAKCSRCLDACPHGAIRPDEDGASGGVHLDRALCQQCDEPLCAEACPSQGLIVYGRQRTVQDVLDVTAQDAIFYARSGGGITLSGGEPLLQTDFALALLREARRRRFKIAVETCGAVPWEVLHEAAGHLHTVLFDIKHMNSERHKEATGMGNERILDNLKRLLAAYPQLPVLVRTPVIPGFNDTDDHAQAVGEFLAGHANVAYEALPYHRLGTQKYTFLGLECPMGDVTLPQDTTPRLQKIVDAVRQGQTVHRQPA